MQSSFLDCLETWPFAQPQPPSLQGLRERICAVIKQEILRFRQNSDPIIFLEFKNENPTIESLSELVQGYSKAHFVIKNSCDGSQEILAQCQKSQYQIENLYITGISISACVSGTIEGLLRRNPSLKVNLITNGCNGDLQSINEIIARLSTSGYDSRFRLMETGADSLC